MSVEPMPRPDWFVIKDLTGANLYYREIFGPLLVRNQAEVTMLCERLGLDPTAYKMGEASPADLAFGQLATDYCEPASTYELPPEVVDSMRRCDQLKEATVKLRHDMCSLVDYEVPTSKAEANALSLLIGELEHWQSILEELWEPYDLKGYEEDEEDEDE